MNNLQNLEKKMEWWGVVEFMARNYPELGKALEYARCDEWGPDRLVLLFPDTEVGWESRNKLSDRAIRDILEGHLWKSGYPVRVTTRVL